MGIKGTPVVWDAQKQWVCPSCGKSVSFKDMFIPEDMFTTSDEEFFLSTRIEDFESDRENLSPIFSRLSICPACGASRLSLRPRRPKKEK